MHREPEVLEAEAPKERAPIHSVKNGILQNACSTSPKMDADLRKSALLRIARLMNKQPSKRSKNDDQSAWPC